MNNTVIDMSKASDRREIAPVSEANALISAIERASRDPSIDIVKLKELFAMRKEIAMEAAKAVFNAAMTEAQKEMRPIAADAENPQTRSKYASYAKLDRALRPIYTKHGFAISYDEGDTPKTDHVRCLAYVSHSGGFTRTYRRDMPADGKGAKGGDVMTKTHAVGAAHSYGDRYLLKGIFNIAVGEDDNDGNYDQGPKLSQDQVSQLDRRIREANVELKGFLEFWQVDTISEIHACNFSLIMQRLDTAAKRINPRPDLTGVDTTLRDKRVSEIVDLINEYGSDEQQMASQLQAYHQEYLQPFPELFIAINDKLAADKILSKASMKKLLSLVLKP